MKLISLIFFQLCCCSFFEATKATVLIGGITYPRTRIGKEQKVAIKVAIDDFSSSDSVLLLNAIDLNGTSTFEGISIARDLIQWGADVILATGTSEQVMAAGTTGSGAKTPVISLIPTSFVTGPFTLQISYSQGKFVHCIADFVKFHGWRKVITVYEDDALGLVSSTNLILEDALSKIGTNIEYHAVFPPKNSVSDLDRIVIEELRKMMTYESTVYIVLQSSESLALSLFQKANDLMMTSPKYVWICGNDITDILNTTLSPTFVANNMQGIVGIKSFITKSKDGYRNFKSKFQQMFASDYGKNEHFLDPGVYAARAYDAVHAVSLASKESKMKNISLVEALSMVDFEGLSGKIPQKNSTINNNENIFSVFGIVGKNCTNLGIWNEACGFCSGMKNLSWLYGLIGNQNATKPGGLRTLKVGIPAKPFWNDFVNVNVSLQNCSAEVQNISVSGFCIDVFTKALEFLKYNASYQFVAYKTDSPFCNVKTYNDLANLVNSEEIDVLVADVTILADRSKNVSFTQPFLTSELVMLVQKKSTHIGWLSIKPFSPQLWGVIVCILICFISLVWLLERKEEGADRDFRGPIWIQVAASVWLLCNSIFLKINEGIGSYHTKIILLWWFLFVQVLLSSFIASLSSILVVEKQYPKIDNLKIGYNAESFLHDYLLSNFNYKPGNLVKMNTPEDFSRAFDNGSITAAYLELPYLRVFLTNNSNYDVIGESRTLGGFGFVFPKQSPLRGEFSTAILRLQENGTIRQLQSKWFNIPLSSYPNSGTPNRKGRLGLANFAYFFMFITGFAVLTALHKLGSTVDWRYVRHFFVLLGNLPYFFYNFIDIINWLRRNFVVLSRQFR